MNPPPNLPPYGLELWNAAQSCIKPTHNGDKGWFRNMTTFKDLCSPSKIVALLRELAPPVSQEAPGASTAAPANRALQDATEALAFPALADRVAFLDELGSEDPEREAACREKIKELGAAAAARGPTYGRNTKVCDHCKRIHPREEECNGK